MAGYCATFEIKASSEVVWSVLTDFERYSEWNPALPSISGNLQVGSTVSLKLRIPGLPLPRVKARITEVVPRQRLAWHGNAGADWLFGGDHEFLITARNTHAVEFTNVENVQGVLAPLYRQFVGNAVRRSHEAFNVALKQRAEELGAEQPTPG